MPPAAPLSQSTGGAIAIGQDQIEIRGPLANAIDQALAERDAEIERLRAALREIQALNKFGVTTAEWGRIPAQVFVIVDRALGEEVVHGE